jgi:hypothetical protein
MIIDDNNDNDNIGNDDNDSEKRLLLAVKNGNTIKQ